MFPYQLWNRRTNISRAVHGLELNRPLSSCMCRKSRPREFFWLPFQANDSSTIPRFPFRQMTGRETHTNSYVTRYDCNEEKGHAVQTLLEVE